jgi:hypothetical protein
MIANRVQEQAFGTLNRATLKLLDGLARRGGGRRSERNLKIGTVLVRDYQGRRHTADAPNSMARAASAIMLQASTPTICTPSPGRSSRRPKSSLRLGSAHRVVGRDGDNSRPSRARRGRV